MGAWVEEIRTRRFRGEDPLLQAAPGAPLEEWGVRIPAASLFPGAGRQARPEMRQFGVRFYVNEEMG